MITSLPSNVSGEQWGACPDWKIAGRPHLSKEGETAILAAFESGMRPAEVARLFRISERAAVNWQHRWQSQKPATLAPSLPRMKTVTSERDRLCLLHKFAASMNRMRMALVQPEKSPVSNFLRPC
jgi:hypothetical protein